MFLLHISRILQFLFVFFLMIRRLPRSTLFPTRRSSDLFIEAVLSSASAGIIGVDASGSIGILNRSAEKLIEKAERLRMRSEEHTSELQSRVDLVCRLLLEKKKI